MTAVFHKHGYLGTFETERGLGVLEIESVKRFADVFGFAYDRFLELEQKEQRARQAEVEAALERVRSQALSMQTSDDLPAVSAAVFREFRSLYPAIFNSVIAVVDEAADLIDQWTIVPEEAEGVFAGSQVYEGEAVALENFEASKLRRSHPFYPEALRACAESEGTHHLSNRFSPEEVRALVHSMEENGQWTPEQSQGMLDLWEPKPFGLEMDVVQNKHGYLFLLHMRYQQEEGHPPSPLAETEIEEVRRFSKTFSFAYDRFLELQDKERRAREAEVEAAIERIRSQALTMQTSEDLPSVAATLYTETTSLFADAVQVGISVIGICDEEADLATQWTVLPKEGAGRWKEDDYVVGDVHVQIERFALSAMRQVDAHWNKAFRASGGESVFLGKALTLEDGIRSVDRMVELGQWSPEYGQEVAVYLGNVLKAAPSAEMGHVQFKHGYLWSVAEHPRSESEIEELKRIGDVFAFAYDRFLELQDKERRAREAEIEAALERIRSCALGMQTTEDLPSAPYLMSSPCVLTRPRSGRCWTSGPTSPSRS